MRLTPWLQRVRNTLSRPVRRRGRGLTPAASVEVCESRTLLTVTSLFNAVNGELHISSNAADAIAVGTVNGEVTVNGAGVGVSAASVRELDINGSARANLIDLSGVTAAAFTSLLEVEIDGYSGNDTIIGSEFNDDINGGAGSDHIDGGVGNDSIRGSAGRDSITGGAGDDVLNGGPGRDDVLGGAGNDSLNGQGGGDILNGESGDDSLFGASGSDDLNGGTGSDALNGASGSDSLLGGDGDDLLEGGGGADDLFGGLGNDHIDGGTGSDSLSGDDGDDYLNGGDDDDYIRGGLGDDNLIGGSGVNLLDGDDGFDSEHGGYAGDFDQKQVASLVAPGGAVLGVVEFELSPEHGDMEVELEIQLSGATPGVHDISIGGAVIGQMTVNAGGFGAIEFSNQPDDFYEVLLPANLPAITNGTSISIGTIASGVFGTLATSSGSGSSSSGSSSSGGQETELEAFLTGVTAARGEVEFETEFEHGRLEREFEVEVVNAAANAILDVSVNGVVVAQITTNAFGRGKLELSSHPDDADEQLLPATFADLVVGDVIEIGGVLSGILRFDD